MRLRIQFVNGLTLTLISVSMVRLVGYQTIETQTFGNDPVTQRGVRRFDVVQETDDVVTPIQYLAAAHDDDIWL